MAATLPYPNMDFTPLDVLTAAEMDQMVANDKYLADFCTGLANGTNLENGMIPLSKLKPVYSKDRIEVGTWIDGRKVYRKVYTGAGNVPAKISVEPFKTIIDMRMIVKNSGQGDAWRNVPWLYNPSDATWAGGFYVSEYTKEIITQLGSNLGRTYWWHIIMDFCVD